MIGGLKIKMESLCKQTKTGVRKQIATHARMTIWNTAEYLLVCELERTQHLFKNLNPQMMMFEVGEDLENLLWSKATKSCENVIYHCIKGVEKLKLVFFRIKDW